MCNIFDKNRFMFVTAAKGRARSLDPPPHQSEAVVVVVCLTFLRADVLFFLFSFSLASAFMRENAIVFNHLKEEEIKPRPPPHTHTTKQQ